MLTLEEIKAYKKEIANTSKTLDKIPENKNYTDMKSYIITRLNELEELDNIKTRLLEIKDKLTNSMEELDVDNITTIDSVILLSEHRIALHMIEVILSRRDSIHNKIITEINNNTKLTKDEIELLVKKKVHKNG